MIGHQAMARQLGADQWLAARSRQPPGLARERTEAAVSATTVSIDGVTVVAPRGRVDSQSAGQLGNILRSAMSNVPPLLVVDMSGINYIGSKGLQALLGALSECRHAGGDLKLASVSPNVMHVLNIIQFDRLFSICHCVDSALADFQADRA